MHRNTKIATCCYCGTRAALVLGADRHELMCSSCGAPLHALKQLPRDDRREPAPRVQARPSPSLKTKPRKKRKKLIKKVFEEAFDILEDIFD